MIEYENLYKTNAKFMPEYKESFNNFLNSGWYILGKAVEQFESEFAEYNKSKYCVGVASGLDALTISLKCMDFPNDGEVIVPSNTYIATIIAIYSAGLKPVLVEPDIKTYLIDPEKIPSYITKKTVAIMPVHLYGKVSAMPEIMKIARRHKLCVIEDCAQSHGSKIDDKFAGTFGHFGAFSFYPTKNLGGLGDGGAILCKDKKHYEKAKALRNYGSEKKYYNKYIGLNSRLDEIQAGFLSIKLKYLDEINSHKRKLADIYNSTLSDKYIKPIEIDGYYDTFHIYPIRFSNRNKLKEFLFENGVKTEIHYPKSPHRQAGFKGLLGKKEYPISDEIHNTILSLPISYMHSEKDVKTVINLMNSFV